MLVISDENARHSERSRGIYMKDILKNKFFLTAAGISLLILIVTILLSPKKSVSSATPTPTSSPSALSAIVPLNLSQDKLDQVVKYTSSIKTKLPLSIDSFSTSVGIETSIYISGPNDDAPGIVNLDINGLSYINKNELNEKKNPNVTAFKESFGKAIELLEGQNIDPNRLLFSYGNQSYVNETVQYWITELGLLK